MFSREMLPVVVIAESVGYASESSFHKAFVREFGCTPGEYRERVRLVSLSTISISNGSFGLYIFFLMDSSSVFK
ncbi:helix-turn-helix domain-containing protein, partial [Escherichia coli]|uniref:helix-turn-helix domain-containing protein n=1 Tax=Escherichia coli TaxID=562 RepID=UPI000BD5F39E